MPSPIEALTFDAAGTLFHLAEPVGATYSRFGEQFGLNNSAEALEASFRLAWKEVPELHSKTSSPSTDPHEAERQWWRTVVDATFQRADALERPGSHPAPHVGEEMFGALFDHFAQPSAWKLYPETHSVLQQLSTRFPMVVISNFDRRFHEIAEGLGISRFFHAIVLSGEIGHAKPSVRMFAAARDSLNLLSDRILHIGDDPDADWNGARNAGFQCFELNRPVRSLSDLTSDDSLLW